MAGKYAHLIFHSPIFTSLPSLIALQIKTISTSLALCQRIIIRLIGLADHVNHVVMICSRQRWYVPLASSRTETILPT
jgi:hypothetical protein